MSFNIVVTDPFKKQAKGIAKKHPSLRSDLNKLIDSLEKDPAQGEPLGKDCYKVRMAITSRVKVNPEDPVLLPALRWLINMFTCLPFMINPTKKLSILTFS